MNPRRAASLAALVLALAAPARAESIREMSVATWEAAPIARIEVHNPRGVVEIVAGGANEVRLEALKVVRARRSSRARRLADETMVEAGREGDRLVVRVRYPSGDATRLSFWDLFGDGEMPRTEMRLLIRVPARLTIDASTTSGDVRTRDLAGPQRLESTSGDLEVEGATGPVHARTTSGDLAIAGARGADLESVSGDIHVAAVSGPVRAMTRSGSVVAIDGRDSVEVESVSGDLTVRGAPRGVRARTTSGDVVVRDAAGRVRVSAASGDVETDLVTPLDGADVRTTSGTLVVRIAEGARCRIDMRTSSGEIHVRAPLELETVTRHKVEGTLRGGSAPVVLQSSSGDIIVKSGGS